MHRENYFLTNKRKFRVSFSACNKKQNMCKPQIYVKLKALKLYQLRIFKKQNIYIFTNIKLTLSHSRSYKLPENCFEETFCDRILEEITEQSRFGREPRLKVPMFHLNTFRRHRKNVMMAFFPPILT